MNIRKNNVLFPSRTRVYTIKIFYRNILCMANPQSVWRQIPKPPTFGINFWIFGDKKALVNSFRNIGIFNVNVFKRYAVNSFCAAVLLISCYYHRKLCGGGIYIFNFNITYSAFEIKLILSAEPPFSAFCANSIILALFSAFASDGWSSVPISKANKYRAGASVHSDIADIHIWKRSTVARFKWDTRHTAGI